MARELLPGLTLGPCKHGHDGRWRIRKHSSGGTCKECMECCREKQAARRPRRARTGYVKWVTVEDTWDFCEGLYGPARALEEATRMLGVTPSALRLHLKRHGRL